MSWLVCCCDRAPLPHSRKTEPPVTSRGAVEAKTTMAKVASKLSSLNIFVWGAFVGCGVKMRCSVVERQEGQSAARAILFGTRNAH